jgi:PhnB protein
MKTRINVYLNLNGKCEEAMNFYKDCLGGELILNKVEGSQVENEFPPEMKNKIMHSELAKDDMLLMATDGCTDNFQEGNNVSLFLNCATEDEIRIYFDGLSVGGRVIQPLEDQFWGALFEVLTDKYGITWMLSFERSRPA